MERLGTIAGNMADRKKARFVDDALSYLEADRFFGKEINDFRLGLRKVLEEQVRPRVPALVEAARFPDEIIALIRPLNLLEKYLPEPFGRGLNPRFLAAIVLELGRIDGSLVTAFLVQNVLFMNTISEYADEEMKQMILPKAKNWEVMGGWGLTEREIGSDASNLQTAATQQSDGSWLINGNKRWIGLANKHYMITFARDTKTKNVLAFLIDLTSKGVTRKMIEGKLAARSVHNMDIELANVRVEERFRLKKVRGFEDVAKMLAHSRLFVCWVAVGIGLGLYDDLIRYVTKRQQFGRPIAGFQLVQSRVVQVMGNVQAALHMAIKLTELHEQGKGSIGKYALGKSWITKHVRESAALARESLGGNGILIENNIMKAMADMEVVYTYEGTYDINLLVSGRELTGIPAFK